MTLLNVLVQVEGADRAASLIGGLGSTLIDTAVKADRMTSMMAAASGSVEAAGRNMSFVKQIAQDMGADIITSANTFSKLQAATRGTRLEGEQTKNMFEALVAANSKLGGSTDDLTGMVLAFSQMVSKGTVSMEELRGQLGERLPGALKMAADSMNLTTAELIDQISKGKILSEDLLPKLADAINNTYNDGKFDTASANINRLKNDWELYKQSIIDSKWVSQAANNLDVFLQRLQSSTAKIRLNAGLLETMAYGAGGLLRTAGQAIGVTDVTAAEKADEMNLNYIRTQKAFFQAKEKGDEAEAQRLLEKGRSYKKYLDIYTNNIAEEIKLNQKIDSATESRASAAPAAQLPAGTKKKTAEERAAEKAAREYEAMMERSRDLMAGLENDYMTIAGRTLTDGLEKITQLAEAQKQAEIEKVRNAHLSGEQQIQAETQLQKVLKAIDEKAANDRTELQRKTNDQLIAYENSLRSDIASTNSDKLTQLRMAHEAELKSIKDRYDKEKEIARRADMDTSRIDSLYNNLQLSKEKKYSEDRMRISGGYWEKLSLKMRDSGLDQANMFDTFTTQMVDATMGSADMIATGFADMAVNSKSSWNDMALSIIKSIEMMIAKMMILWGVQQLVGLAGGMIGGETGGLISQSVGMSPFNGSGMFASFGSANGNAFNNGEIVPFANGGIVDKPMVFPMAKGTGLMGEAGPEAIMPLTRDGNGRLGVKSHGNSSSGINIGSINVSVPADKNPEKQGQLIGSAIQRQIKQLVQLEVKDSFRPGNTMNPSKTIGGAVLQG